MTGISITVELQGIIPPMITPLTSERGVDIQGTQHLVQHMISGGVSGIFALGSSGEGPWLTKSQQQQTLEAVINAANGQATILAGALEPSTTRTIEAIHNIEEIEGVDAIVVTTPYYFATSHDDQIDHFTAIASATKLPIVLYNIPPTTHTTISPKTVRELLHHDNIVGIKDSAGDVEAFQEFLGLRSTRSNFQVMQGAEKLAAYSILAGADGVVTGLGNIAPKLFVDIYKHAKVGNSDTAKDLQSQANMLWELHTHDYWLKCLKFAAAIMGFGSGTTCGHNSVLSDAAKTSIRKLVEPYLPL